MDINHLVKAKRTDNKEWVKGYIVELDFAGEVRLGIADKPIPILGNPIFNLSVYEIDKDTVCKCVGIEDKTKNLLFEHDIIEKEFYTDYDAYANSEAYAGVVRWQKDLCTWDICTDRCNIELSKELEFTDFANHFKVVGNELDNPELLEKYHILGEEEDDKDEVEL